MPGQRKDYVLDEIERLRQFVARLAHSGERMGLEEALQLSFRLQEKLFPLPPPEFLGLTVADQLAALRAGESAAQGDAKCLAYARLLQETAALYDYRGRADLATGARQLSLQVALTVALGDTTGVTAAGALVTGLLPLVDPARLHPPVRELLNLFLARDT